MFKQLLEGIEIPWKKLDMKVPIVNDNHVTIHIEFNLG
jgi:hypothetical protein